MSVPYTSRAGWGARSANFGTVAPSKRTEFFVHYDGASPITRTGNAIPKAIEATHRANGWATIGYNFVVDQAGNVYEGRGWNGVGAHCPNHNTQGIGVQVAIGGDQEPSTIALIRVRELYEEACQRAGRTLAKKGHRDGKATSCPGDKLYAWVRSGMPASVGSPVIPTMPVPAPAPVPVSTLPPLTPSGGWNVDTVVYLQRSLNRTGATPRLVEDGGLGPKTVTALQRRLNHTNLHAGGCRVTGRMDAQTVRALQLRLNHFEVTAGRPELKRDGDFGFKTLFALQVRLSEGDL